MMKLIVDDHTVSWICALPTEQTAARAVLDQEHELPDTDWQNDSNSYRPGRITTTMSSSLSCLMLSMASAQLQLLSRT